MNRPKAIVDKAKELILRDGWVQGVYRYKEGRCISGALKDASRELGFDTTSNEQDFIDYMRARTNVMRRTGGMLPTWNDKSKRTKEEVLAALTYED
jgi:hypothetical protein